MICKECGAYNPDHASYCKVCAANLKENSQNVPTEPEDSEPVARTEERPVRNFVRSPIWTATPAKEEAADEPANEEPIIEEPVKERPMRQRPVRRSEPVEQPEQVEEEDTLKQVETPAETVLEPEAPTTTWSRKDMDVEPEKEYKPSRSRRPIKPEYDDESDELDDDDYDEYEYVPTTPTRRKKSKKGGQGTLFWVLIATLIVVVCVVVVLGVIFRAEVAKALNLTSCAPETTAAPDTTDDPTQGEQPVVPDQQTGAEANNNITLTEIQNDEGTDCIKFDVFLQPNDTLTLTFPNADTHVSVNSEQTGRPFSMLVPKYCYYPNTPLDQADYTVKPDATIKSADGTETKLNIPSFTLHFETVNLSVTTPTEVPAEGIMAAEGNILHIEGTAYDHTVSVSINGEPAMVYAEGVFNVDYTLKSEAQETITILAQKNNCVSAQVEFEALPYVFVPEPMVLTVVQGVEVLRASESNKVTVRGTTTPGATLAATSDKDEAACGSFTVDATGNYSFDVTFNKDFYGLANVTITAVKEGHDSGSVTCCVTRGYKDRQAFIKTVNYFEVPKPKDMAYLMEHYKDENIGFRLIGKVTEVFEENGYTIVKFSVTSGDTTYNVYVVNQSSAWKPADNIGKKYKLYCSPNGTYGETEDLFLVAWYAIAD